MVKVITIKVPEDLAQQLDLFAVNSRLTRSDVVREAIRYYLSHVKKNF